MIRRILCFLVIAGVCGCGCRPWGPQFKQEAAKRLVVVDNGYVRQYLWDGGEECGFIQGGSMSTSYLAGRHGFDSLHNFVRRSDAIAWVEQRCPNAIEESVQQ